MELKTDTIAFAKAARPRGFVPWNPKPPTRKVIDAVHDVLHLYRDQLPLTIRQIYYRLVATEVIGKTQQDYKRLCEYLNRARRARMIRFEDIRDDGVTDKTPGLTFSSIGQVRASVEHWVRTARFDPDYNQPVNQIVLCEAGGMVPMLGRAAAPYGVTVYSSGGFDSLTAKHDLGQKLDTYRPNVIWHVGDYDPSGVHVYQSMADDVTALADAPEVIFKRLAIVPDQIDLHGLPMAPAKATDARAFDGTGTVQAEALPPDVLQALVSDALASQFDPALFEEQKSSFDLDREALVEDWFGDD